jgi:pantothenate kinase
VQSIRGERPVSPVPIDLRKLADLLAARASRARTIVAIAGAPGSGKSAVAERLLHMLNERKAAMAAVLPMDGFHYDDGLLEQLGRRARKGATDTFDVGGFLHVLERLRRNSEEAVAVPLFDRSIEISRGSARLIPQAVSVIIVEGNYLLLRSPPWSTLRPMFDVTVMVETDPEILRRRLSARWKGFGLPAEEIRRKVEENDLPNGRFVIAESAPADFVLSN